MNPAHDGLQDPDAFHEAWLAAHEGLDDEASAALDARLVILLADRVGDARVIAECIRQAREAGEPPDLSS